MCGVEQTDNKAAFLPTSAGNSSSPHLILRHPGRDRDRFTQCHVLRTRCLGALMSLPLASFLSYFLLLQRWVILVSFQSQETTQGDAVVRAPTWPSLAGQLPVYSWQCCMLPARSRPKPRVGPHCHWQTTGCMRWWHGAAFGLYV